MADLSTDTAQRRRGRPKGTGIDDSTLLQQIASLMAGDPALKPTTAIKLIGIENPSVVRRLREKVKVAKTVVPAVPPRKPRQLRKSRGKVETPTPKPTQPARRQVNKTRVIERTATPSSDNTEAPKVPPTTADTGAKDPHKAREAALLAAYLKALQATAVPALDDEQGKPATSPPQQQSVPPAPPQQSTPAATSPSPSAPPQPTLPNPFAAFAPPGGTPTGTMFPFMPPFLQPFAPKPPPANPLVQHQMEAMKLSVEVMTAVAKLQMFTCQNALAGTPFGNMLQAQTMMGQMLLASFAGMMGGRKPTDKT